MADTLSRINYFEGTHRIFRPEATLGLVQRHLAAMGITRVADVTGLDTVGIPVVMVCRPNSRSVSVSQGKGSSLVAAKVSGLMESIEGFHAENISLPLRIGSFRDMSLDTVVVNTNLLPGIEDSPFHENMPMTWIEAVDLMDQCGVWVPYEMVHTNYTYPRPTGSGSFPASSNGLASGNSIEEATVHAICEVIERDAISLWHQFGADSIDSVSIDPNSIEEPLCVDTLEKLQSAEQDTYIWDLTSDTGIPTYMSVIVQHGSGSQHIGVGSGTHLSKSVALLRALHEAVQVRTTYIVGARDDITLDEYTSDGIYSKHDFFQRIINQSSFSSSFNRTADLDSQYVSKDLESLMFHLQAIGINQVLRVDLTKSEFNIPVVRVVIPGLEAPHDDYGYVPGPRARMAQEQFR
ncbi:MAG: YcaO-like family protein [bacterium]